MLRIVLTALTCVATLSGCSDYTALAYHQDRSLHFTAPPARTLVKVPFTLRWEQPASPATSYAVFIDRAPVRPGHSLRDVAGKDEACKKNPACPDAQYLADRGVYVTTDSELTLTSVAPLTSQESIQLHDAVVVMLDARGRRIGESGWRLEFKLRKRTFG